MVLHLAHVRTESGFQGLLPGAGQLHTSQVQVTQVRQATRQGRGRD